MVFLPPSIEDYVSKNDPVRVYDAFVEALDLTKLGIEVNPSKAGNSSYAPKIMLKLLVYGYSYGETRSSRKLERALHHNLSFIWLMRNLKPDHKTIAEFRRKNRIALAKVLKECVRVCLRLDLIEGNTLFVDGTKIRANASIKNAWTKERCEKTLERTDKHIEELLNECEAIDASEEKQGSLTAMKEELSDKEKLKSKVKAILKELKNQDQKAINTTDSECGRMNSPQGNRLKYSGLSTDQKSKLYRIVQKDLCLSCHRFGECAKSKHGKSVSRLIKEEIRLRFEEEYLKAQSQAIYKLRQQKAELPFGHIKRNLGINAFLLRGLKGVKAEASLFGTCFNLRRMMTLLGVTVLIAKLAA